MTSLALSRSSLGFKNSVTTHVVLAAANKLQAKPMIPLESDDHHHHDETIKLPNTFNLTKVVIFLPNLVTHSSRSKEKHFKM